MYEIITTQSNLKQIPVTSLYLTPLNGDFALSNIEELMTSIQTHGLIQPLAVCGPDNVGRYEILAGNRRITAILKIREETPDFMPTVPCHVVAGDDLTDTEKRLVIETSNINSREDIDVMHHRKIMIQLFKQYEIESTGTAKEKIARNVVERAEKFFGISKRYARMFYNIFGNDNQDVEELLKDSKVTITQADKILNMPKEDRETVVNSIKEGNKAKNVLDPYIQHKKSEKDEPASIFEPYEPMEEDALQEEPDMHTEPIPEEKKDTEYTKFDLNAFMRMSGEDDYMPDAPAESRRTSKQQENANAVIEYLEDLLYKEEAETELDEKIVSLCRDIAEHFN